VWILTIFFSGKCQVLDRRPPTWFNIERYVHKLHRPVVELQPEVRVQFIYINFLVTVGFDKVNLKDVFFTSLG
jgi:hypothetical protein